MHIDLLMVREEERKIIALRAVKIKFYRSLSKLLNKTTPRFQYFLLLFTLGYRFHSYSLHRAFHEQDTG